MNSRRKRIVIRRDTTLGRQLVCLLQVELPMKNLPESLQRKLSYNYESWFLILYLLCYIYGKEGTVAYTKLKRQNFENEKKKKKKNSTKISKSYL